MLIGKLKIASLLAGLMIAASATSALAANPFAKPTKPKPLPAPTVEVNRNLNGGLTAPEVMALMEQRMTLLAEEMKADSDKATDKEIAGQLTYIGRINKNNVYKDEKEGCYIYENAKTGEMDKSRCYQRVASRLRDNTPPDPKDKSQKGN